MLVYGDAVRNEDVGSVLDELAARAATLRAAREPLARPWILEHARLVGLFIRAGELVQGLEDAAFACREADDWDAGAQGRATALRDLAALVLRSWAGRTPAPARQVAAALAALAAACPAGRIATRQPEGYGCYALYPESYGLAAATLAGPAPVVIGLRSIGTSLGAMVAARTGAPLFVTLRPTGDAFHRVCRLSPGLAARLRQGRDSAVALVDEGPGLSGSSMAGAAATLEALGWVPQRIHFLPSHNGLPGPAASEPIRARWQAARRLVVSFDAMALGEGGRPLASWVEDLTGPALRPLEDIGGGRWRDRHRFPERPPGGGMRERRKFLLTSDGGTFLLRFVGLGEAGEAALARGTALSEAGFLPPLLGLRHGFLVERWLGEARPRAAVPPGEAEIERLAAYLAFRARRLPAAAEAGASLPELARMAVRNSAILLGRPVDAPKLLAAAARLDARRRPVATDNRLHRWEWLELPDGRLIKTDGVDHCAGHELVGCQDIAWDVAGATIEFGLDAAAQRALCARLARRGVAVDPELLRVCFPCYAAFQAGRFYLDAATTHQYQDKQILEDALVKYRHILEGFFFSGLAPEPSL